MDDEEGLLSQEQRKRSMKYATLEGMAYTVMAGLGDSFLPAAAVILGATNFYIGLLSAVPELFGGMLQSVSLTAIRIVKSRKILVLGASAFQAISWLAIVATLVWPGELSVPLLIVFFSLGAGAAMLANPAWGSWISDIVPGNERGRFFANRNRLMHLTLFVCTFGGGILLRQLELQYSAALAFATIFVLACLARLITLYLHHRTEDVRYEVQLLREMKLKHLFLLPAHRNEMWFLMFMALVNFSAQFASPFFTPYMLNELHFDIGTLGVLTAISVIAKIAAFPYWGRAVDWVGNRLVLLSTAVLVPLVPILWLFSKDFFAIGLFQIFSGFVWSGFDLASFNAALSIVGRELRPSFISKYNAFNGVFYAAGSVAGGLFLQNFGGLDIFGYSGIMLVFLLSGLLRLFTVLVFAPTLRAGRDIANTSQDRVMILNLVAIYPTQGAIHHALDGWNFTRKIVAVSAQRGKLIFKMGLQTTKEVIHYGGRKLMRRVSAKKGL